MTDDPDTVWMTYDEAAKRLHIQADSVRRRAAARKWPKRLGNDGKARVGIPLDVIPTVTPAGIPAITTDNPDSSRTVWVQLATAHARIEGLEARLADTQAERDRLARIVERALDSETGTVGPLLLQPSWRR